MRGPDSEWVATLESGTDVTVRTYGGAELCDGRVVHTTLWGSIRVLLATGEHFTFNPTGWKRGGSWWLDRRAPESVRRTGGESE